MTISKETVTNKVTKETAALKEVVTETTENLEKLGKEAQQKVAEAVTETKPKLEGRIRAIN